MSTFFCFSFDPPTLADVLFQPDPPWLRTCAFPDCSRRAAVCRRGRRLHPINETKLLVIQPLVCWKMLNVDLAQIGPENTKSDISKRMSESARHPPPPCPHFSAFQVPPSPPSSADVLYEWSLISNRFWEWRGKKTMRKPMEGEH